MDVFFSLRSDSYYPAPESRYCVAVVSSCVSFLLSPKELVFVNAIV